MQALLDAAYFSNCGTLEGVEELYVTRWHYGFHSAGENSPQKLEILQKLETLEPYDTRHNFLL